MIWTGAAHRRRGAAAAALAVVTALAVVAALAVVGVGSASFAARDLSPIDLVDLEVAYDTLTNDYYQHVDAQRVIEGARAGVLAYLRQRGVRAPSVPALRASGRYAHDLHVPGQEVADALLRYGNRVDAHAIVYAAIAGEAAALRDPYTVFFTPEQERRFYGFLNPAGFGGIGVIVHVDARTGRVVIDEVIPGGPADRAGLEPGDWIFAIDGTPTKGESADAIQAHLRGKVGSGVMLSYGRGSSAAPSPVRVVRAEIKAPDTFGAMLQGGVGYIRLLSYGANAAEEVDAQLRRLDAAGARAYVLDLRGNGGGYRDAAIAVTSRFVPEGPIVIVQARNGKRAVLDGGTDAPRKPLAVLVNGATASAAEITAGAIQDTKSGTLVGTTTYGKGLVQQVFPLPDGAALKVTVERYETAHGRDIDHKGIVPDVAVAEPEGSIAGDPVHDPQLARALSILAGRLASPTP